MRKEKMMNKNWEVKKLGDVVIKTESTNPSKDPDETFLYVDISSINRHTLKIEEAVEIMGKNAPSRARRIIKEYDILFATVRPTLKRIAIVPKHLDNQICSTGYYVLRVNEMILNKYLFYFLLSEKFMSNIDILQKGANYPAVTNKDIESQTIPLPPLSEQHRIVSILDQSFAAIDQAISRTQRNLNNAKEVFESYLNGVFEEKGEDWEEKKIKELGYAQTGTTPKTSEKENFGDYIPFIKPADINFIGKGDIRYNNEGLSKKGLLKSREIKKDSILMVCIGATIGKVGFADRNIACNQQINTLTLNEGYHPKFFYFAMTYRDFQKEVLIQGKGAQATLPIVNKTKWENLSISYPKSLSEQTLIDEKLESLQSETQRLEAIYRQKLKSLEELKKSMLEMAFRGEL